MHFWSSTVVSKNGDQNTTTHTQPHTLPVHPHKKPPANPSQNARRRLYEWNLALLLHDCASSRLCQWCVHPTPHTPHPLSLSLPTRKQTRTNRARANARANAQALSLRCSQIRSESSRCRKLQPGTPHSEPRPRLAQRSMAACSYRA